MDILNKARRDNEILVEQIKRLYRTLIPMIITNLAAICAITYGLWDKLPESALLIWIGSIVLVLSGRIVSYFIYKQHFQPKHVHRFAIVFVIGTGLTGVMWGCANAMILVPDEVEYQLFMLIIVGGLGAGAVNSLTAYLPAFFAFFPVSMLPAGMVLLASGDSVFLPLSIMVFVYIAGVCYIGISINLGFIESLQLRFENLELVELLRKQKDAAETANHSKSKFLTGLYDAELEKSGLRMTQLAILAVLNAFEVRTMRSLAFDLGLDPSTMTRTLQPLLDKKLIRMEVAQEDARAKQVMLTAAGHKKVIQGHQLWEGAQRSLREQLGAERFDRLVQDLVAVNKLLKQ